MSVYRIILVVAVFALSTFLFQRAACSLRLTKLNMISVLYYYILFFNLIGGSLIYIGFRDHYLLKRILFEHTYDFTYYALAYCVIVFPLVLIIMKNLFHRKLPGNLVERFIGNETFCSHNMQKMQQIVLLLTILCALAIVYVFMNLGYIPILEMLHGGELDVLRQSGSRFFQGNQYVKNLIMLTLTPFLSYYTYIYYRITRNSTWCILFIALAVLSVVAVTYDFSKSPIITYVLGLYLLEVCLGNIKNGKRFALLVVFAVIVLLFFYVVVANVGNAIFSIYTGPLGRIFFTQIATMFLHTEAFPVRHEFLDGASFNGWMSIFFPNAEGIRSGRVVMEIYNAKGIQNNTAGVMNTIFIGEAYANFGVIGIIIAPIIFGAVIGFFAYLLPNLKKRPTTVVLYVQLALLYAAIVEGGFVDIFYSASIIFLIMVSIVLSLLEGSKVKYMSNRRLIHE